MGHDYSYSLDVASGHHHLHLMIDTGCVDPHDEVGIALETSVYDTLQHAGLIGNEDSRLSTDASGHQKVVVTGSVNAQLLAPTASAPVGSVIQTRALRGFVGVVSRVGVAFFHRLADCRVTWDFDQRSWCIEYP
jgi:hypothetical protein